MKKLIWPALLLASAALLSAGCTSNKPWAMPDGEDDCAILCKVSANSKVMAGCCVMSREVVFKKQGSAEEIRLNIDPGTQDDFPYNPLLLKVTPGKWAVKGADYTVSPGYNLMSVTTGPDFSEPVWVDIKKGEIGLGYVIEFDIDFKVEGDRWKSQNTYSIKYSDESRMEMLEDALLYSPDPHPWRSRLLKAKKNLAAKIEAEKKKKEEEEAGKEPEEEPGEKTEEK